jgi:hypothetical protein
MIKQVGPILTMLITSVYTAPGQDFEVAPIKLVFSTNPGEVQSKTITVKNHGNISSAITLTLKDYLVSQSGERRVIKQGSSKNSIANWITLSPSYLEMNPNQSQTVQVNFQAPNDDFSSKWGILSVSTAQEQTSFMVDKNLTTGMSIYGTINVELYYTPIAERNDRVTINNLREITASGDSLRKFTVNIDNLGSTLTNCKIFLIASNLRTLEEKQYKPIEITAYPQTSRNVELTVPKGLPEGIYSLSAILDYGSNEALRGTQITIEVE